MKKENTLLLIVFYLLLALSSCVQRPPKKDTPKEFITVYDLKFPLSKPLISGHRGAKEYVNYPENCLETFQYLRSKLNCIIECDVAQTKDGVLVLMHDHAINRTTNGEGRIEDMNYSELKDLQLKDYKGNLSAYKIPKFSEILKWAHASNTILSVDKKKSAKLSDLIQEIEKQQAANNCMMISYSSKMSQEIYDLAPDFMQSVSIRNQDELARWEATKIPPAEKTIAFTGTRPSPKELYEAIHQYGIACIFGTLGNIDNQAVTKGNAIYQELLNAGVDIIATDRPLEVGKVVGEK